MKVFNSKLAAIGLAAFVFASCSDSSSDPATPITPGTVPSEITKIGLTQTDAAQLAASVTNYKRSSSNKARTRAFNETLFDGVTESTKPTAPSADGAKQLNAATDLSNDKYKTRSGKTYDFSNNKIENTTLFVVGNSTVKYSNLGSGNTIVVQKGGKLEYTGSGSAIPQGNTIYVLESGSYSIANENITIDGALYSSRALGKIEGHTTGDKKSEGTPTQNITINGSVYLSGYSHIVTDPESENYNKEITEYASLRAKTLTINAGAKVNTLDRVTFTDNVVISGALHVGKAAIVKNMTIKNGGVFYSDYSAKIKNKLTMEAGSYMDLKYLNVTDNKYDKNGTEEKPTKTVGDAVADLQGNCQIVIGNHGVMSFNTLKTDNTSGQIVMGNDADNVAVIKADKFIYAGSDENVNFISTPNTNNQTILAQLKECYKNGTESEGNKVDFDYLVWNSDVQDYYEVTGTDGGLTAGPNFSYVLKNEYKVADQKKLMLLSTIANNNRDTQSATAIVPTDNNKVYVSYHTRGAEFGGSIDVAEMNGEQLTLKQRVQQAETGATYDFNHLNVINSKLYLAGSAKGKDGNQLGGAAISYAAIGSDGLLNVTEGLTSQSLDNTVKGDANCVMPFGDNIAVASTLGYSVYDPTLVKGELTTTAGKAKFVAVNGSSLVGLNYTSEITAGDAEVQGEVQVFDNSMKQTSSFNVGAIAPNNGKNMIAIDSNGRIYVCKSAKGLMCYESNGSPAWESEWKTPVSHGAGNKSVDNRQGYINGVAVDDNYVYVAAGAYGLVVLTKDGKEVTHKRIGTSENSANYVAVKNGLIYVAYGKGRIQVFKLTGGAAQ